MKVSENFSLEEFMSTRTYSKWGTSSIWFLDQRVIHIAQLLRDRLGASITINGIFNGHTYNMSGFRPPYTKIGAKLSQHRFGRAVDVKVSGVTPVEVDSEIKENFEIYKKVGLTTIENVNATPTWNHLDCRWTDQDTLKIVNP